MTISFVLKVHGFTWRQLLLYLYGGGVGVVILITAYAAAKVVVVVVFVIIMYVCISMCGWLCVESSNNEDG